MNLFFNFEPGKTHNLSFLFFFFSFLTFCWKGFFPENIPPFFFMYFCFFFFRKDRRRVKKVGEEKKKPIFVLCRTTPIIAKPFFTLHAHLNSLFFFFYKFDWKRQCNGKWRISLLLFTIQTLCVYFISWSFYPLKTRGGEQKSISNIYWVAPPPSFPLYCCWLRPFFFY